MVRPIFCIALLLAITACKQHDKIVETWVGAPETRLVAMWGAPSQSYETKDGTRVVVYTRSGRDDSIVPSAGQPDRVVQPTISCETAFTIQNGSVVSFTYGGRNCSR